MRLVWTVTGIWLAPAIALPATVSGRLVDDRTRAPLAGTVHLLHEEGPDERLERWIAGKAEEPVATVSVKADGRFRVELPPGDRMFRIEAVAGGHLRREVARALDPRNGDRVIDEARMRSGATLKGQVLGENDRPIAGASVTALPIGMDGPSSVATTLDDGTFEIASPGEEVIVTCHARGYGVHSAEARTTPLVIRLGPPVTINGRITESETGTPLPGAIAFIEALALAARSDARGRFVLGDVAPGVVTVNATGADRPAASWKGPVPAREPITIALPAGGRILAAVLDRRDRKPIAGARVVSGARVAITDARGDARLAGLPPRAELRVSAAGFEAKTIGHLETTVSMRRVPIALERTAVLAGEVVDDESHPIADASVWFNGASQGWPERSTRTDARGTFRLDAHPGALTLAASREGFVSRVLPLKRVSAGEERAGLRLVLGRGASVTGTVVDAQSNPVPGAEIAIVEDRDLRLRGLAAPPGASPGATTDAEGRYTLGGVVPGKAVVTARRPGFARSASGDIEAIDRMTTEVDPIVLRPGATLSGHVVDAHHEPVEGALVAADGDGTATTGAGGAFTIPDLDPARTSRVSARADGRGEGEVSDARTGTDVEIVLSAVGRIRGQVVDHDTGLPVQEARVMWWAEHPQVDFDGVDEVGAFEIAGVPIGKVELTVTAPGYRAWNRKEVEVEEDGGDSIAVEMERGLGIHGRVADRSGAPVASATVSIAGGSMRYQRPGLAGDASTDGDGAFTLDGLDRGVVELGVSAEGFVDGHKRIDLEDSVSGVEIRLDRGVAVRGTVRRRDGTPAQGVHVELSSQAQARHWLDPREVTDAEGAFAFDSIAPGVYQLQATSLEEERSAIVVTAVAAVSPPPVLLTLRGGVRIEGALVGPADRVAGVAVQAYGGGTPLDATTDTAGRFTLDAVPAGELFVLAHVGSSSVVESVTISGEIDPVEVVLRLPVGSLLSGQVTLAGRPVADATVTVSASGNAFDLRASTDASGSYEIDGVPDGVCRISVYRPGPNNLPGYTTRALIAGDTRKDIAIELGTLRGRVVDAGSGAPITGAQVHTDVPGDDVAPSASATTAADGTFQLEIADGQYVVVAEAVDHGSATAPLVVTQGQAPECVIRLPRSESLVLRAMDLRTGYPPPSARVTVLSQDVPIFFEQALFGDQGRFPVPGIGRGTYTLVFFVPGAAPSTLPATNAPGEIPVRVSAGGRVQLALGVPGALRLLRADGTRQWFDDGGWDTTTMPVGPPSALIGPIEPGSYRAIVTAADGAEHAVAVTVRDGETVNVTLP
ncbi:MAG: carboxypeptidase regulatory-like domain-containing protein [Acidobacteriota bacterium]